MRKLIALFLILASTPAFATFGAASAWDVRTTGVDTNGGAFDSGVGSPGTDESQGSGTAITVTLTGTTTGTGSPVFSATTHGPGNFVHIASGSGCTTGWFEVLSQAVGVATFDHAMGVATNVCVGTIGGSLLTIGQANTNIVASNTIWIQSGTYTLTTSITWAVSTGNWTGYQTTHGDNGTKPLITTATNSVTLINTGSSNNGVQIFTNLSLSNTATTRSSGIWQLGAHGTAQTWIVKSCLFDGFTVAVDSSNNVPFDVQVVYVFGSEFKNNSSSGIDNTSGTTYLYVYGSNFHDNGSRGISGRFEIRVWRSIFANNSIGVESGNSNSTSISSNTFFGNSASGVALDAGTVAAVLDNNLFYGNTGRAINAQSSIKGIIEGNLASGYNAFGNNTTSNSNWPASATDVAITANPFISSGTGNFALNSTAGGGAALKGAGYPGIFPGATSTGSLDVGAVQTGGGGTSAAGNFGVSN